MSIELRELEHPLQTRSTLYILNAMTYIVHNYDDKLGMVAMAAFPYQ